MPTRRAFLVGITSIAVAPLAAQTFDLAIVNGRVIDPESGLDAVRNIGIRNGRLARITTDPLTGGATINAGGLVVCPGFVDLHAHQQTPETHRFQARDGVTTAFELELGTSDVDAWYAARSNSFINHGVSIGHIPVRAAVMRDPGTPFPTGDGAHRAATPGEIAAMSQRIAEGLKKGAVSIGAGFAYTPAANDDELLEIFRIAARERVTLHVHTRRGMAGVEEVLRFAGQTGAPLHIVHINSTGGAATREVLQTIAAAQARGVNVTTEAYPYAAGMTEIQSANLDEYEGASAQRVGQLEWPRTGERLTPDTFQKYRKIGGPVVLHNNTDEMVALAITSPLTMVGSDSYWENGTGHPRTTGTFSRVLGRYVRDARSLTLMEAIRKMTLMPAERLAPRVPAMKTKGRLREGADADIAIFDAARIIDRSTYREPGLPPAGMRHVIVNGVAVVANGELVKGVAPGKAIRA
jgi:N-acyl-D-aspartate/D-glutamate deacylase